MQSLFANVQFKINENLFIKNPETSTLGKKVIEHSILLINEIGFDNFTFKKLGEKIGSNESSIYRYFENKHKLLLYLSDWYWSWIEYKVVFSTNNISNPSEKLLKAVKIYSEKIQDDTNTSHVNELILNKIIINEFTKTFLTKEVDLENSEGYFLVYKRLVNRLTIMIQEVDNDYKFAKSLASSIIEGSLHQHFLREHLQTITNDDDLTPQEFYIDLVQRILKF